MSRFRGPVRSTGKGFRIAVDDDEAALIRRLAGELRSLLTDDVDDDRALMARLFPTAYPDDEELEAEYQRLMREELVASKLAALDVVEQALSPGAEPLDEVGLVAFMQSINSVRLILGTMLEVSDDLTGDEVRARLEQSPEYALYGYLSWLLEHCVRALS
ncbi:MAG: DUF2017 family protein [Ilumatobacteraceae bacterium]